ncbi:MAG: sulfatase-like hydrolase/transferase [Arcobacteraceae bacterium]|nr:sulfatase-like hydrolase/transferase [Arcobacteraceae bacterium]
MKLLNNYQFFLKYILLLLSVFFISRFILVIDNSIQIDILFFIYSLRMDIIVISALLILPIIAYTFNLIFITRLLLTFFLFIIVYLEIANYLFFEEFNTRLNYLFIEYLEYPKAVFDLIWKSYQIELFFIIPFLIYITYKFYIYSKNKLVSYKIMKKLMLFPLIIIILFLGLRSSVDSSTPNQSFYSYSNSTLKNDIVNNTTFSLLYALYLKSKDKMPYFGKKDKNLILKIKELKQKNYVDNNNLLNKQLSTYKKKNNITLVIMESFGTSYVGSLGGTLTTPYFDKMAKDGLFMSNMYSSSNRSNRGFEAILSSIFPIYGNTYLKLPKSQKDFWTIARTMKKNGYKTIFLYGGDSKFDNMKGFAISNGFDKVIDKYDFDSSIKRYTWGVCDEELYKKANEILENSDEPLFLVLFTLSSHKPFDYPDNKIDLYKTEPKSSFANSVKYADFALNKFYEKLKIKNYFNDGLLCIVADHNAHMFGDQRIPVNEFKIPALFITSDLKPRHITNITHQIDIAPTLLDLAGIDAIVPTMGTNLTKSKKSSALIVHRRGYAYLKDNSFALYFSGAKPKVYDFNYKKLDYNKTIIEEGLMYIYGSYAIYNNNLHKDNF